MNKTLEAMALISEERARQDEKWGTQEHNPFTWNTILMEEVGEYCQEALKHHFSPTERERFIPGYFEKIEERLLEECVQVAAVATAMVECLLRKNWQDSPAPEETKHE